MRVKNEWPVVRGLFVDGLAGFLVDYLHLDLVNSLDYPIQHGDGEVVRLLSLWVCCINTRVNSVCDAAQHIGLQESYVCICYLEKNG